MAILQHTMNDCEIIQLKGDVNIDSITVTDITNWEETPIKIIKAVDSEQDDISSCAVYYKNTNQLRTPISFDNRIYSVYYWTRLEGEKDMIMDRWQTENYNTLKTNNVVNTINNNKFNTIEWKTNFDKSRDANVISTINTVDNSWSYIPNDRIVSGDIILSANDTRHLLAGNDKLEIKNIKLFPDPMHPVAMECTISHWFNDKRIKTKCVKGDEFSLTKGLYIALAKFFDRNKEYTPEGIEYQAKLLSYQKDYYNLVEKAAKKFYKDYKQKCEDDRMKKLEEEREEAKKQKAIEKKKKRMERQKAKQREEKIDVIAEAIKRANSNE